MCFPPFLWPESFSTQVGFHERRKTGPREITRDPAFGGAVLIVTDPDVDSGAKAWTVSPADNRKPWMVCGGRRMPGTSDGFPHQL